VSPPRKQGHPKEKSMTWHRALITLLTLVALAAPCHAQAKKKVLLISQGPDGHPASTHEYEAGLKVLAKCLEKVPEIELTTVKADDRWKEGPDMIGRADGVVLFLSEGAKWVSADAERLKAFNALAARGGGFAVIHWAMGTRDEKPIADFVKLFGGCHGGPDRKYKVVEVEAEIADAKHPVATGIAKFKVKDEFYYKLKFAKPEGSIKPVLQVPIEGNTETVAWTWERADKGRSFGFSGLHFHDNWKLPEYRRLVAQGVLWSVGVAIPKGGLAVDVKDDDLKLK